MSSKCWIINASPVILLGKIGRLDLLEALAPTMAIPDSVIREIEAGAAIDPASEATLAWAKSRRVPVILLRFDGHPINEG